MDRNLNPYGNLKNWVEKFEKFEFGSKFLRNSIQKIRVEKFEKIGIQIEIASRSESEFEIRMKTAFRSSAMINIDHL